MAGKINRGKHFPSVTVLEIRSSIQAKCAEKQNGSRPIFRLQASQMGWTLCDAKC